MFEQIAYQLSHLDPELLGRVFFFSSALGILLLPESLGKRSFYFLAWYSVVHLGAVLGWFKLREGQAQWLVAGIFLFGPLLGFVVGTAYRKRKGKEFLALPLRELILWHLARLMGLFHLLFALLGTAPFPHAAQIALSESLTAVGALLLVLLMAPEKPSHLRVAVAWNAFGFIASLHVLIQLFFSIPGVPAGQQGVDLYYYFTQFNRIWYGFWVLPLSVVLHLRIFLVTLGKLGFLLPSAGSRSSS